MQNWTVVLLFVLLTEFTSQFGKNFNPLKPSGHYMYRTVVTICTASLTFNNSTFCPHSVFTCLFGSQNKQRLFPYTTLTDWFYNRDGVCLLRDTDWEFIYIIQTPLKPSGHYTYHQFNNHTCCVLATQCFVWI